MIVGWGAFAAMLLALGTGGNLACRLLFWAVKLAPPATGATNPKAGRVIGWLERLIIAAGILGGSWEVIAAVIALKSVARFKELDRQVPAEYFLVGSLFSLLWAIAICGAWLAVDRQLGLGVGDVVQAAIARDDPASETPATLRDGQGPPQDDHRAG